MRPLDEGTRGVVVRHHFQKIGVTESMVPGQCCQVHLVHQGTLYCVLKHKTLRLFIMVIAVESMLSKAALSIE